MIRNRSKLALAVSAAAMCLPMSVFATNGILPLGNGMTAHGLGGAGIANPGDSMAGADNPALLSETKGQASVGASIFNPRRSMDFGLGQGYVESDSNYFIIPQAAWIASGTPVTFGVVAYAMGGMNTDYPENAFYGPNAMGPGTPGSPRSGIDLSGLIVAPTAAYTVTPGTSIGASLLLGYARLKTEGIATLSTDTSVSDSSTGFGVKLGVESKITPMVHLGATYQPKMSMSKMKKYCDTIFANSDCRMTLPAMFGVGTAIGVTDSVKLVGDIQRVQWSKVSVFKEDFGWKDQTLYKVGAEFKAGQDMMYRVGFNYGKSPIPNEEVATNVLAPAVTEKHITVGFTKKFSSFDLIGYYARVLQTEQTGPGPFPGTTAKIKMDQNALGFSGNWKF